MDALGTKPFRTRIWLDLATPPQVLFFKPVVRRLRTAGVEVSTTVRRFGATEELAGIHDYEPVSVGGSTGKGRLRKVVRTLERSAQLAYWAIRSGPFSLAISYNSYSQALAARTLGIRFVTFMDYEHQPANRICFRMASSIVVPEGFDASTISSPAVRAKVRVHPGLKEHAYLHEMDIGNTVAKPTQMYPSPYFLIRTPADYALYHQFENTLFDSVVKRLARVPGASLVILPRTKEQRSDLLKSYGAERHILIPERAGNGPDLIRHAAAVISAGGTMAREAAVLGVPSFSIFAGAKPGVDKWLERRGTLCHLSTLGDLEAVSWEALAAVENKRRSPWVEPRALDTIVAEIMQWL